MRFARRRFTARVGSIARRATGRIIAKRILLSNLQIPDVTAADYDNPLEVPLLECLETMDEEIESDGTNVADVPLYSRLLSMRLKLSFFVGTSTMIRWMIYKEPDGESLVTNLATQFHTSDDTPTIREIRKNTLAKGFVRLNPSTLATNLNPFIKRATMKRLGGFQENDRITLVLAKDSAGTTAQLDGMGTAYVRANA